MSFRITNILRELRNNGSGGGGGSGSVNSFTFADANGFDGTVTTPTTNPVLSLATNLIGLIRGFGGSLQSVGTMGNGELLIGNGTPNPTINNLTAGVGIEVVNGAGFITINSTASGAFDHFSFADANGFMGVVTNASISPELTLSTNVSGLIKGSGGQLQNFGNLSDGQLLIGNGSETPDVSTLTAGTGIQINNTAGAITINSTVNGTLTSFGFTDANGFRGDVINPTTSPQLTLSTATSGLLISDGTSLQSIGVIANNELISGNGTDVPLKKTLVAGVGINIANTAGTITISSTASGTFDHFEFANANGFRGVVSGATLAPILTLQTGASGLLKSDGTSLQSVGVLNNGQLLIGNGTNIPFINTLTAGAGINIFNTAGTITISSTASGAFDHFSFADANGFRGIVSGATVAPILTLQTGASGLLKSNGTSLQSVGVLNNGQLLIGNGTNIPTINTLTAGAGINILNTAGTITISSTASGSFDKFSFTNANGFRGVVSGVTTSPILTLQTGVSGLLKSNGTSLQNFGNIGNGQLLIGNGTNLPTVAGLTAGTGISISNASGSITIFDSFSWVTASTNQLIAPNKGYVSDVTNNNMVKSGTFKYGDIVKFAGNSGEWNTFGFSNIKYNGQLYNTFIPRGTSRNWSSVASSADGTKLIAVVDGGGFIYTSTDSGITWGATYLSKNWKGVASSADGTKLVAVADNSFIFTSTDSGTTWVPRFSDLPRPWRTVASSADGTKLIVAGGGGSGNTNGSRYVYVSSNGGVTWSTSFALYKNWTAVASSADGTKLVAVADFDYIFTSTNSGLIGSWIFRNVQGSWKAVASSADGNKLVAVADLDYIYTSSDGGIHWNGIAPTRAWRGVTSSADGTKLIAVENSGKLFISTNSGINWYEQAINPSNNQWSGVSSSADGSKIVACALNSAIYTSEFLIGGFGTSMELFFTSDASSVVLNLEKNIATNIEENIFSYNPMQVALLKWYTRTDSSIDLLAGANPTDVCFDGTNIWVSNYSADSLSRIKPDGTYTNFFGTHIKNPSGICFDGTYIWVTNYTKGSVAKLSALTGVSAGTFAVGTSPFGICFDGTNIWVTNSGSNNVTKLLAKTGAFVGTYSVGNIPNGICFDGTNIWVVNNGSSNITKLLASNGNLVSTYTVGSTPNGICFDGTNIWVANNLTVKKILASTGEIIGSYFAGNGSTKICFDGINIWSSNFTDNSVAKINTINGNIISTHPVGVNPSGICFDGVNIWVANYTSNTVSKL